MLNRRILRIKAFKVLYSYAENPSMDLKEAQRQLRLSCEATRDLYLFLLALVRPLTEEAAARIADFAALIENILNETLLDDYTDMEKALALRKFLKGHGEDAS